MGKSKSAELYKTHALRGLRLSEALERKKITQAELLRQAKKNSTSYFDMSPQTLNQIIHGKRPLHYEDAVIFADILDVEADYLMGHPDASMRTFFRAERDAKKYKSILGQIGSNVYVSLNEDDELNGYWISYNNRPYDPDETISNDETLAANENLDNNQLIMVAANFDLINVSIEDMEIFYQDVCSFIRKRLDVLIALNKEEV